MPKEVTEQPRLGRVKRSVKRESKRPVTSTSLGRPPQSSFRLRAQAQTTINRNFPYNFTSRRTLGRAFDLFSACGSSTGVSSLLFFVIFCLGSPLSCRNLAWPQPFPQLQTLPIWVYFCFPLSALHAALIYTGLLIVWCLFWNSLRRPGVPWLAQQTCQAPVPGSRQCWENDSLAHVEGMFRSYLTVIMGYCQRRN